MDCSTPGFPVHRQLAELAQTHVHLVGDAIQSSHLLSCPPPPFGLNLSYPWVPGGKLAYPVLLDSATSRVVASSGVPKREKQLWEGESPRREILACSMHYFQLE